MAGWVGNSENKKPAAKVHQWSVGTEVQSFTLDDDEDDQSNQKAKIALVTNVPISAAGVEGETKIKSEYSSRQSPPRQHDLVVEFKLDDSDDDEAHNEDFHANQTLYREKNVSTSQTSTSTPGNYFQSRETKN
jgi:hypothetical protein